MAAGYGLEEEMLEMVDAQAVDVAVIGDALLGQVGTQVGAVSAYAFAKLCECEVVLEIELGTLAMFAEQHTDVSGDGEGEETVLGCRLSGVGIVVGNRLVVDQLILTGGFVGTFLAVVELLKVFDTPNQEGNDGNGEEL